MSKTFTCKELGGICDKKFSGKSLKEIMDKGMKHMSGDQAHMEHIAVLAMTGTETKDEWQARMQKAFKAKSEDK
jgi:predicted small metal-binding protein